MTETERRCGNCGLTVYANNQLWCAEEEDEHDQRVNLKPVDPDHVCDSFERYPGAGDGDNSDKAGALE